MNSLVTGATGFVGSNLVEALNAKGWPVRALRRATSSLRALDGLRFDTAVGDVTDFDSLGPAMRDIACVFHVAAALDRSRLGVDALYRVNVGGTHNVLKAALGAGVKRVVITSSVAALGQPDWRKPASEGHQFNLRPSQFHYGNSKVLAEQVALQYAARGLEVVIVNPAVILGPRDVNLVSGGIILELRRHAIPVYPPGGVAVIDVADVCAGHIAAAERGRPGARYILSGQNLWHRELLGMAADIVGRRRPCIKLPTAVQALAQPLDFARQWLGLRTPLTGEYLRMSTGTYWFDNTRARTELGLNPRPAREALRRTYAWYMANGVL